MSIYLHDIPLYEAQERLEQALIEIGRSGRLGVDEIALDEKAAGRVTAEAIFARISSPHYHASAMDGFAIRSAETAGAMPTHPVSIATGEGTAGYLDTGDPLPAWADAVVPVEQVEAVDESGRAASDLRKPAAIRLRAAVPPWSHVRPMGEDMVATQIVLPAGHRLRPVDLGALAASGHSRVRVSRQPVVAILPTGSELVPVGTAVKPGDIIEFNSLVLAAQVREWGGTPVRYPITPDEFDQLKRVVQQAADESDLVLINAGSSAGSEDFSAQVVAALGELLVHGVAVRPGHPVILGTLRRSGARQEQVPVIGVPGYPVSAALTGEIFMQPLLARWLGQMATGLNEIEARLTRKVTSPAGDDEYLRIVAGRVGKDLLASPLPKGAGVISSLVRADGIVLIPRGTQGLEAGSTVRVRLYRPAAELENTVFATGSHDMTLDLLAQFLAERGRRLVSANVGSLGGLVALRRGEAHLAGTHLLDADTGEYNLSYLPQYLAQTPVMLVAWVGREQGLLVPKGNPEHIRGLEDLARAGIRYSNRQRGAGTRVLLDYHLKQLGIGADQILGYDQEEYTHLAVAAAVASGRADTGLGIRAAAHALDLDFVSLFHERYDLAIPCEYAQSELLAPLFILMQEERFRQEVAALPGYDVSRMGQVITACGTIG